MVETVSFRNKAVEIAGHLHLPDDFDADKKYPAFVGIHPAGGVKEQTIGQYAKRLASHGFVTVVYDSSYQGESGGEPRLLEDPTTRVEDARCAADFLTTLPYVDTERMGVFGICAGGGYAISVGQTERRFKAVARRRGAQHLSTSRSSRKRWKGSTTTRRIFCARDTTTTGLHVVSIPIRRAVSY